MNTQIVIALCVGALALGNSGGCRSSEQFDTETESWQHTLDRHSMRPDAGLDAETTEYLKQVEAALAMRAETIQVASGMKRKLARGELLSGAELDLLNRGTVEHMAMRAALLKVAHAHESWLYAPDARMRRENPLCSANDSIKFYQAVISDFGRQIQDSGVGEFSGVFGNMFDFNFDVQTTDRIVCSELCYVSITDIDWQTDATLGRATISPDNVAAQVLNRRLDIVLLYHRANPVSGDRRRYMKSMME